MDTFSVASNTTPGRYYTVWLDGDEWDCQCTAASYRRLCSHVKLARELRDAEQRIMTENKPNIRAQLAAPFLAKDIDWRIGSTNQNKDRGMALAYITARAVMERLDDVFGIEGWHDHYQPGPSGGVLCSLSCRIDDEWVTKQDVADNSEMEPVKGGVSDALKRAAVKFGVGRYLYNLDAQWVAIEQRGRTSVLTQTPKLPDWALPEGERGKQPARPAANDAFDELAETEAEVEHEARTGERPANNRAHVDTARLSQLLGEAGVGNKAEAIASITGDMPDALRNSQKAVAYAVELWALNNGINADIETAFMEAVNAQREEMVGHAGNT